VQTAAEEVLARRDDVAAAEAELAAAEVELAAARAAAEAEAAGEDGEGGTASTTAPTTTAPATTTTEPLVPSEVLERVERAEADLLSAAESIDASTPVVDAAESFNSAALALQVASLQLLDSAGCIEDDQRSQALGLLQDYTVALQTALRDAGLYDGEIDGIYGPATVAAVEQLQQQAGLPVTGLVDRRPLRPATPPSRVLCGCSAIGTGRSTGSGVPSSPPRSRTCRRTWASRSPAGSMPPRSPHSRPPSRRSRAFPPRSKSYAVEAGCLARNPAVGVKLPKVERQRRRLPRPDELEVLADELGQRWAPMMARRDLWAAMG